MEIAVKAVAMEEEAKRGGSVAQGAPPTPAGHKGYAAPNPLPPWLLGAVEEPPL